MALNFFIVGFLFLTSLTFNVMGRPIIDHDKSNHYINEVSANTKSILDLATIAKDDHEPLGYVDFLESLGQIKNSGPSPGGKGHESSNAEDLGDMKNSGPSPGGKGHGFQNAESLGDIKNSGPSPGGDGHNIPTIESLGTIKNSGPSPGGKGHGSPTFESLGDIKESGPSPGGKGH